MALDIINSTEKSDWDSHMSNKSNPHSVTAAQAGAAPKESGVYYVQGAGTTDTTNKIATWTGTNTNITKYFNGLTILYKISTAGSTTTTLNINNLGAIPVVKNATSAISTSYAVNSVILLVYTTDSGTAYWKAHDYDSNTKTTTGTSEKAATKLFLAGATSQASSATTYSNAKVYIGTDNFLYSNGTKVSVDGHTHSYIPLSGSSAITGNLTPSTNNTRSLGTKEKQWNSAYISTINPGSIEFIGSTSHGGYIDFHYGASTDDYTSRIIESSAGVIDIIASKGIKFNSGALPVANGGTGATTFTSGCALIGAGTGAVTTRAITNNTAATTAVPANTNLITANTLRYALNRTTATTAADTNYTTAMVRSIKASSSDLTAGSSELTSGMIYLVYE